MPDQRRHRGPHPQDHQLFAAAQLPALRAATHDLSWLASHGYASTSALKLVGDRYALDARQRVAASRCACSDQARGHRQSTQWPATDLRDQELWIDGYNVLTSLEAALAGGVILHARDDCYRDMASMHGNYRKVEETRPAIQMIGELLEGEKVTACHWLLDQPVSNSGRLKAALQEQAEEQGWNWSVELVPDPDPILSRSKAIVASADSQILDHAERWINLARLAIDRLISEAWIVDLSGQPCP